MIDLALFRRPRFGWGTAAGTIGSFTLFGLLFVLPQFLQAVLRHDALGVGLRLLPLIAGLFFGSPFGVRLAGRFGTRVPVAGGLLIAAAGLLLGAGTDVGSGYGFIATWLVIAGLGTGLALAPAMDAVMGELPRDEAGSGTAVTMTLRQVGGALGVALLGSLSAAVYASRIGPDSGDSVAVTIQIAQRAGDAALAASARVAYVDAMGVVLLVCAAIAVLGAVLVAVFLSPAVPQSDGAGESVDELTRVA